jgi:hypothetical protein
MNEIKKIWEPRHASYTRTINYLKGRLDGTIKSLVTPWKSLNAACLDGLEWGTTLLLAARPGIGKSILQDQLVNESFDLNPAQNFRVLKWELEMLDITTNIRELSAHLGKSYQYLCSAGHKELEGEMSVEDLKKCIDYFAQKAKKKDDGEREFPIDVISTPPTVEEFEQQCELYAASYPDTNILVTVDHIRLIRKDGYKDENKMLYDLGEAIIRMKRNSSRPNKITFVLLTHLNRNVDKDNRSEPGTYGNYMVESDIFGSDSMAQACDVITAWDRPAKRQITQYGPKRYIVQERMLVSQNLKVRNGDTGMTFYEALYEEMRIVEIPEPPRAQAKLSAK